MQHDRWHGRTGNGETICAIPGCDEPGEFRAPDPAGRRPGRDGPGDWQWLCLDHVRAFNAKYNYFEGMTPEEIAASQSPYAGWETETRAFAHTGSPPPRWADFRDPLEAIQARFARPAERADGRELFFARRDGTVVAVAVGTQGQEFTVGAERALFGSRVSASGRYAYDVSADGQRFLVNTIVETAAPSPITLVVNWSAALHAR